ncbi:hypothetical protein UFOVP181_427 [uncultured Caudovirales phage]|uniref:Uncharacterized protein n=1 Tax=uncultured Caudovirales phage TaxID=2100421 RepID=A0A6J7WE41_9CAUD|nr:hypothetical protein UFOVP57_212 [uncultured Caudovirales phage]CAB5209330.1 hypothetical protein UFOVP181_427 [uncultured Caudovirales phage]
MNDLYERTITVDGKVYHYDPDRDIYYPRPVKMTWADTWGWVIVSVLLAVICFYLEYLR